MFVEQSTAVLVAVLTTVALVVDKYYRIFPFSIPVHTAVVRLLLLRNATKDASCWSYCDLDRT